METSYLITLALISALMVFVISYISKDLKKEKIRAMHYRSPSINYYKIKWKS